MEIVSPDCHLLSFTKAAFVALCFRRRCSIPRKAQFFFLGHHVFLSSTTTISETASDEGLREGQVYRYNHELIKPLLSLVRDTN